MKRAIRTITALALILSGQACADSEGPVVAHAADYVLTVDEAVELLVGETQLPAQAQVAEALANLWADYTLLADAASRDSTLANVDVDGLVRQQLEAEMIMALRDTVVQVDTAITDTELERLFRENAPGVRVRARHILLSFPSQADAAQRDSIRQRLASIRARIEGGESFEDLATEYSQDRASAVQGGDLGWFERGQMVQPFDEAAFALEPGEMSDIVESPFGLHLIRVEEKEVPTFDERRAQFRQQVQTQRQNEAESTFVADLQARAELQPVEDAVELTKQVARDPEVRLSGRAGRRPVVTYQGGELTLEELQSFLQTRPPQYLQQLAQAPDDVIESNVLTGLAQREILIEEARERGLEPAQAVTDSLERMARENFRDAARTLQFTSITPGDGQSREDAVQDAVMELLRGIIRGERDVLQLGPISWALRQQHRVEVMDPGIEEVVARIESARGPQTAPATPSTDTAAAPGAQGQGAPPPAGETPAQSDTSGGGA